MSIPRILILGGGFGGAYCAQALSRRVAKGEAHVTLVDRNNYFVFYPLLLEAGTGSLPARHAVVSLRAFTGHCSFRLAEVGNVDLHNRQVHITPLGSTQTSQIDFDHLVVSLGSVTRRPDIPGLQEHAFEIKSLGDAVALREHAIRLLEMADAETDERRRRALLHLVVVGANFTGVEAAGELQVFLRQAARQYPGIHSHEIHVSLVELGQRLLPALDPDLASYALEQLRGRGIDTYLGTSPTRLERNSVTLADGTKLESYTTIWCAGIAPNPLLQNLPVPLDERGYILCDKDLRVRGLDNVWAVGDCAVNPDPDNRPYPATAQSAVRQGRHLAANLMRAVAGDDTRPFAVPPLGSLAALGCRTGVAKVLGIKLSGFPAWFLWRTVYLLKMPGLARKLRVALDWTLDLFFKREIVQLGLTRGAMRAETNSGEDL